MATNTKQVSAKKFYRVLIDYVRWLEQNGDPNIPYAIAKDFAKKHKDLTRTNAGELNRYFGKFLEADHLVEKRFLGYLPSANLDPEFWDSKVVPKNTIRARELNKFRNRPFPYNHKVKTALMKKLIPHGMEGNFKPQEIWDAHAWAFKQLGIEEELENLKDYFRNAKVKFRIPKKNPLTRKGWREKVKFKNVPEKKFQKKSPKKVIQEKRTERKLESARQRQAREEAKKRKNQSPKATGDTQAKSENSATEKSNRGTTGKAKSSTGVTVAKTKPAGKLKTFYVSAKNTFRGTIKYVSLKNILKFGAPLAFDMFIGLIGGMIRTRMQANAQAKLFGDFLDDPKTQEKMDEILQANPGLQNDQDTGWYLHVIVVQQWLGTYDSDGDPVRGLETPMRITLENVVVKRNQNKLKCTLLGFKSPDNAPEGVHWKYERCSYPFLINHVFEQKQAADKFSKAFEQCMQMKLGLKPAGPITPQEEEAARRACARELGGVPLQFEPQNSE